MVLQDVIVKEICFDYREAENDVAKFIKDWTNNSYDVDIFYDGSATTSSVLLVAKKADTPSRKRSKAAEKHEKEDV